MGPVNRYRRSMHLPSPPGDIEKHSYISRAHRWLPYYVWSSFMAATVALTRLALTSALTRPLLLFAAYAFVYGTLTLFSQGRKKVFDYDEHLRILRSGAEYQPSIDVFLPSCGEDVAVLANTYEHVSGLNYDGKLTVYVLDDSDRSVVKDLARTYNFEYLVRPNRGFMKKAGNLKFGYENSSGDIILVLDADFAPRSDFLAEAVPYMLDRSIGILQTPQAFDTTREMPWIERGSGAEQRLFYRFIQPSRDRSGGAICVGTCALYRREALRAAGGFAQIGHSEDVYTGVGLLRAGYRVKYLPIVLAKGLCPDTFSGYVNMMYRWCTGSLTLMQNRGFWKTKMRPAQRACYLTGFLYYIFMALSVIVGPIPALIMVWHQPALVNPKYALLLAPSVLGAMVVVPRMLGARSPTEVLKVQLICSYCFLFAVVDQVRNKPAAWVPSGTAKKTKLDKKVRWAILCWGAPAQLTIVAGVVHGVATYGIARFWAMATTCAITTTVYAGVVRAALKD